MKILTKILLSFLLLSIFSYSYSTSYPKRFHSDKRIAVVNYDENNVIAIRGSLGYVTTISLPKEETISSLVIGADNLWAVQSTKNLIIIKPITLKTKEIFTDTDNNNGALGDSDQQAQPQYIEPSPSIWKTNLVVVTDQRTYNFVLQLVDTSVDFKVNVQIPTPKPPVLTPQEIIARDELKAQIAKDEYLKSLVTKLPFGNNWLYDIQTGSLDATKIKPFYVYDNDKFIYLGFTKQQEIPSVYSLSEDKEHIIQTNTITNTDGTTTLVIFNLYKSLILRSGNRVVQINKY